MMKIRNIAVALAAAASIASAASAAPAQAKMTCHSERNNAIAGGVVRWCNVTVPSTVTVPKLQLFVHLKQGQLLHASASYAGKFRNPRGALRVGVEIFGPNPYPAAPDYLTPPPDPSWRNASANCSHTGACTVQVSFRAKRTTSYGVEGYYGLLSMGLPVTLRVW